MQIIGRKKILGFYTIFFIHFFVHSYKEREKLTSVGKGRREEETLDKHGFSQYSPVFRMCLHKRLSCVYTSMEDNIVSLVFYYYHHTHIVLSHMEHYYTLILTLQWKVLRIKEENNVVVVYWGISECKCDLAKKDLRIYFPLFRDDHHENLCRHIIWKKFFSGKFLVVRNNVATFCKKKFLWNSYCSGKVTRGVIILHFILYTLVDNLYRFQGGHNIFYYGDW